MTRKCLTAKTLPPPPPPPPFPNSDLLFKSRSDVVHQSERGLTISHRNNLIFVGHNYNIHVYDSETRELLMTYDTSKDSGGKGKKGGIVTIKSLTLDGTGQLLVANLSSRTLRVFGIIVEEVVEEEVVEEEVVEEEVVEEEVVRERVGEEETEETEKRRKKKKKKKKKVTLVWTGVDLYDAINRTRRIGRPVVVNDERMGTCIVAGKKFKTLFFGYRYHKIFILRTLNLTYIYLLFSWTFFFLFFFLQNTRGN